MNRLFGFVVVFIFALSTVGCSASTNYNKMYEELKEKKFIIKTGGVETENPLYIYNDSDLAITVRIHNKEIIALKIENSHDIYAYSVCGKNIEEYSLDKNYKFNSEIEKYQLNQYIAYNSDLDVLNNTLEFLGYSKDEFIDFCNWYYNEFHGTSFKDSFNSSHYETMKATFKTDGYEILIEHGTEDNEIVSINHKNHQTHKQLFIISISLHNDGNKYINLILDFSVFHYSNSTKEFYKAGEKDKEADIAILNNILRDIGYSKEELIGFAEWYYEEYK